MAEFNRRMFLAGTTAATVALAAGKRSRAAEASETVVLAVMGVNGRGTQLIEGFAKQPGVRFAYVCDCDERAMAKGLQAVEHHAGNKARGVKDFRQALDDPAVDASALTFLSAAIAVPALRSAASATPNISSFIASSLVGIFFSHPNKLPEGNRFQAARNHPHSRPRLTLSAIRSVRICFRASLLCGFPRTVAFGYSDCTALIMSPLQTRTGTPRS